MKKIKKLKTDSLSSVREEYENKKVSVSIKENSITNLQNEAVEFSKKIQKAENVLSDAALSNEALGNKKKALEEYLNSKNNNLPEIGVEDSTQVKNTNSEDKIGNVDTGIGKRTDKYISIGSVAGLSCLLLRKKKKVK